MRSLPAPRQCPHSVRHRSPGRCWQSGPHSRRRSAHRRVHSSNYDHPALYTTEDLFSEASYWESRYRKEPQAFEWYRGYSSLKQLIVRYLPPALPILQLGVGTSTIQYDMATEDNYQRIVSVDYAPSCVERHRRAHAHVPQLEYQVADCRDLSPIAQDNSYAGVLDKGTLDALLCGECAEEDARRLLTEAWRVLEPGGVYLHITHSPPNARLRYLQGSGVQWASIDVYEVGQQGKLHGPYSVPVTVCGPDGPDKDAALPTAKESYSHWAYACRKRLETCGLQQEL